MGIHSELHGRSTGRIGSGISPHRESNVSVQIVWKFGVTVKFTWCILFQNVKLDFTSTRMNVLQAAQNIFMVTKKLSCHEETPQQKPKRSLFFSVKESVTLVMRPVRPVKAPIWRTAFNVIKVTSFETICVARNSSWTSWIQICWVSLSGSLSYAPLPFCCLGLFLSSFRRETTEFCVGKRRDILTSERGNTTV